MTDKQPKTPKPAAKRPSKGYRTFLRRQKQAARKLITSVVDKVTGKQK